PFAPGALLLPTGDVLSFAIAALLAVAAEGNDVVRAVLVAGRNVLVLVAPRVLRHAGLLQVRAVPVARAGGRGDQGGEPFLAGRKLADLQLVQLQRLPDLVDLELGALSLGRF